MILNEYSSSTGAVLDSNRKIRSDDLAICRIQTQRNGG